MASKAPPSKNEPGSTRRASGPTIFRTACGASRPTKPMGPATAATPAEAMPAPMAVQRRTWATSTPCPAAMSSPSPRGFKLRACRATSAAPGTANAANAPTDAQSAASSPPNSQRWNSASFHGEMKPLITMMAPPQTTPSVTPASKSVCAPVAERRASDSTNPSAPAAPSRASACDVFSGPSANHRNGHMRAKNAPRLAPPAMPSVQGSASGLRKITCSAAPASASAPPAKSPSRTRGRRIWKKIMPSAVQSPMANAAISRTLSFSAPIQGKTANATVKMAKNA